MPLSGAERKQVMSNHQRSANDTGSSEVQIALFTSRIQYLTEHFKTNRKDLHSRFGLQKLVNKRRKLLQYLKRKDLSSYQNLIKRLELRDSY